MKDDDIKISSLEIQESLNVMQLASVEINNNELFINANNPQLCNKIFKKLKISLPSNINKKAKLIDLFQMNFAQKEI